MKNLTIALLSVVMLGALFSSCDNKQKKPPVDLKEKEQVELNGEVSVPYSELGGIKTIPVKLNGVSMDMIFDKMVEENAYIAPYYAGDYLTMADENENLAFFIPDEGTNLFTDAMCIPATSENKEAAEMFINFMCEPVISAANCDMIWYSTPISAAKPLMDEELASSDIAYPDDEVLSNTERFKHLSSETNQLMDDLWISIVRTNELTLSFWVVLFIICVGVLILVFRNMYIRQKRAQARMKY